jgi:fumarylacetoacetase
MIDLNETHNPDLKSWVASANEAISDFPIQNLPFGMFKRTDSDIQPTGCVAIGNQIVVLSRCLAKDLLTGYAEKAAEAALGPTLNPLMALGPQYWSTLRAQLSALLREGADAEGLEDILIPMSEVEMCMPANIGDYTDFYASINHATNVGRLFRPDNPLLPNYKHIPIAYHGRASSIRISGTPSKRPMGQLKSPDVDTPFLGACKRLDYETELGIFVGPGTELGETIALDNAENHIFGFCILNDWSARDIQAWEYVPLGPFLAKNFATTISPWVVTMEAMAPYQQKIYQRPHGDPNPLPYLTSEAHEKEGGLAINFEVAIATAKMKEEGDAPYVVGSPIFDDMYWSVFQMLAHQASGGCNLRPGDFYGSGTISGTESNQLGSLLEVTVGGKNQIAFPNGEIRTFLEDGDEVVMRGWCQKEGSARIGFGECRSVILPATG